MGRVVHIQNTVIAHHLVLGGYGHWLGNDPRGSGSTEVRAEKFEDLGPVHFGRKRDQPSRAEIRDFYREAEPRLEYSMLWFDERARESSSLARSSDFVRNAGIPLGHVRSCAITRTC